MLPVGLTVRFKIPLFCVLRGAVAQRLSAAHLVLMLVSVRSGPGCNTWAGPFIRPLVFYSSEGIFFSVCKFNFYLLNLIGSNFRTVQTYRVEFNRVGPWVKLTGLSTVPERPHNSNTALNTCHKGNGCFKTVERFEKALYKTCALSIF